MVQKVGYVVVTENIFRITYINSAGLLGGHRSISGGGGEGCSVVFVSDKLFISTQLGGALKILKFITCLYKTILEVNYLFHAGSTRNEKNQKYSSAAPWRLNGGPLNK